MICVAWSLGFPCRLFLGQTVRLASPCFHSLYALLFRTSLTGGDAEQDDSGSLQSSLALGPVVHTLVHSVESSSLELDDVVLLQLADTGLADGILHAGRVGVQIILKVVLLLELVLGNEVVKLPQLSGDQLEALGRQPGDLLLGLLEVSLQVELELEAGDRVIRCGNFPNKGIAPAHQGDLLIRLEALGIGLVDVKARREDDLLRTNAGVLRVLWSFLGSNGGGSLRSRDGSLGQVLAQESCESGSDRVNDLLVVGPECGPVHVDHVAAGTLPDDKVTQGFNGHSSSSNAADSRHAGVVPAPNQSSVNQLRQLTLGQERPDKVDSGEVPHMNLAQLQGVEEPLILRVSVGVLGGSQSMGDSLVAVNHGARKVVHGVHLPLGPGAVVNVLDVASVDDGIAHGLVGVVERDLGTNAVCQTFLGGLLHLLKDSQVLLDGSVTALGRNAVHSLAAHSLLVGVVGICLAHGDQLLAHIVQVVKVVRGVSQAVGLDAHKGEILNDGVLELFLLLGRVGVVESQAHLALVGDMAEVVAEQGSLGVSDVKVATREELARCCLLTASSIMGIYHTKARAGIE